jgi:hypothetical protein
VWFQPPQSVADLGELPVVKLRQPSLGVRLFERLNTALSQAVHQRLNGRLWCLNFPSAGSLPI